MKKMHFAVKFIITLLKNIQYKPLVQTPKLTFWKWITCSLGTREGGGKMEVSLGSLKAMAGSSEMTPTISSRSVSLISPSGTSYSFTIAALPSNQNKSTIWNFNICFYQIAIIIIKKELIIKIDIHNYEQQEVEEEKYIFA